MFVFVYTKMDLIIEKLLKDKRVLWTHQLGNRKADLLKTEVLTLFLKMKGMAVYLPNLRFGSGTNLQITAIVTGALAVVLGGDVFWSIIGLFIGQCFGAAVMALHAAQGPKLTSHK